MALPWISVPSVRVDDVGWGIHRRKVAGARRSSRVCRSGSPRRRPGRGVPAAPRREQVLHKGGPQLGEGGSGKRPWDINVKRYLILLDYRGRCMHGRRGAPSSPPLARIISPLFSSLDLALKRGFLTSRLLNVRGKRTPAAGLPGRRVSGLSATATHRRCRRAPRRRRPAWSVRSVKRPGTRPGRRPLQHEAAPRPAVLHSRTL